MDQLFRSWKGSRCVTHSLADFEAEQRLHVETLFADDLLLSTFVHEQLHGFLVQKDKETKEATKDLRAFFPKVPVGLPDRAADEESTYLHLLVNLWEYRADRELLGELRAKQVMARRIFPLMVTASFLGEAPLFLWLLVKGWMLNDGRASQHTVVAF